jgi:hypothetical protein
MKRTKIKYMDLGDKVKVVGIENCASIDDVTEACGIRVQNRYFNISKDYYRMDSSRYVSVNERGGIFSIPINKIMDKDKFHACVKIMKRAGDRLTRIIAEEKAKRVHEVLI